MTLQTVESERDFYFEKLRGIEVMLQVYKEKEEEKQGSGDVSRVMDRIFKVMYATMDDDVVVDDEGNLLGALGDITASSIDKSAFSVKVQEDPVQAEEEEEELLTSGLEHITPGKSAPNQFSNDYLSDLDDEPLIQVEETMPKINESDSNGCFAVVHDDDDSSDEDLLAD